MSGLVWHKPAAGRLDSWQHLHAAARGRGSPGHSEDSHPQQEQEPTELGLA